MRVIPYDELNDHLGFLQMMRAAFGWPALPERVAEIRKLDERCRDPYGFCMVEAGKVVGFAGVMEIPVQTRDRGIEKAGGFFAVATMPGYVRQGVATRLLERGHEYFREQGFRFAFLFTAHTLVAHSLYVRLGYEDLPVVRGQIARAFKVLPKAKPAKLRKKRLNYGRVERLALEATAGRYGFSVRGPGWLKARLRLHRIGPADVIAEPDGYAVTETHRDEVVVLECFARTQAGYERIVRRLEGLGKRVIIVVLVWDETLCRVLKRHGFAFQRRTHGTLMLKQLADARFREAFTLPFYYSPLDQF